VPTPFPSSNVGCLTRLTNHRIGVTDLRGIAQALNDRGVRTARGGRWHVSNVKNVIDRAIR
jgi:Recombinase